MEGSRPYRPRVSRETRLLLVTAVLAIAVLWLLARIRFPDRPTTPNPIAPVLTQLASGPRFDDLASEVSQLRPRLESSLVALDVAAALPPLPALRIRDDVAVTLVPLDSRLRDDSGVLARDPASGLTLVRVPTGPFVPVTPWVPRRPEQSRFVTATDVLGRSISLRPVFVGGLAPIESPLWPAPIWDVPRGTDLAPGSFVFTSDAELAGLAVQHAAGLAIVPGDALFAMVDRLLSRTGEPAGELGVRVQALSPSVAAATRATAGVVVTFVEEQSAAAGSLFVGDVLEAVDGQVIATSQHWDVRLARLLAGDTLALTVRRRGEVREVHIIAPARPVPPSGQSLGVTMRRIPRIGTEVVGVEIGSVAERSGLVTGDVITLVGDTAAPTPAQIRNTFAASPPDQPVLIAVTRGGTYHVMTLSR